MKNKLSDLNNHLFMQLERLSEENITPEELEKEVARTESIVAISDKITSNAGLQMKAAKLYAEYGADIVPYLPQISATKRTTAPIQSNSQDPMADKLREHHPERETSMNGAEE